MTVPVLTVPAPPFDWWEQVPYLFFDVDPEELPR